MPSSKGSDAPQTAGYDPAIALMLARSRGNRASAVAYWRNMAGPVAQSWRRFDMLNHANHELRRALLGIDKATAWCGDRNARIGRILAAARALPCPRLP